MRTEIKTIAGTVHTGKCESCGRELMPWQADPIWAESGRIFCSNRQNCMVRELIKEVGRRKGSIVMDEDSTCVTVHLPNGSMIATPCFNPFNKNLRDCLEFIKGQRIGQVWPVVRPIIQNFGQIAGEVRKLVAEYNQMESDMNDDLEGHYAPSECYGDAFNGFRERYEREMGSLLMIHDLTIEEYNDELSRRISMNYSRHCTFMA